MQNQIEDCFPNFQNQHNQALLTEPRQIQNLENCLQNLQNFETYADLDRALAAEYLRLAYKDLCQITGKEFLVEEVLDRIFSSFCVGKWSINLEYEHKSTFTFIDKS